MHKAEFVVNSTTEATLQPFEAPRWLFLAWFLLLLGLSWKEPSVVLSNSGYMIAAFMPPSPPLQNVPQIFVVVAKEGHLTAFICPSATACPLLSHSGPRRRYELAARQAISKQQQPGTAYE